jgi:hypothetical protein
MDFQVVGSTPALAATSFVVEQHAVDMDVGRRLHDLAVDGDALQDGSGEVLRGADLLVEVGQRKGVTLGLEVAIEAGIGL